MYSIAVALTCLVSFLVGVVWSVRDTGARIRRPAAISAALAACGGLFLSDTTVTTRRCGP